MDNEQDHIMLDLETMGTKPNSSIVTIAAIKFKINNGILIDEFYRQIDLKSCEKFGLKIDADTLIWWLKQKEEPRSQLYSDLNIDLIKALKNFSLFCGKDDIIWTNSPSFDCVILRNAYEKCNLEPPWNFRNERCVRTLSSLNPDIKNNCEFNGVEHIALDDCRHQIDYCCKIIKSLGINK